MHKIQQVENNDSTNQGNIYSVDTFLHGDLLTLISFDMLPDGFNHRGSAVKTG